MEGTAEVELISKFIIDYSDFYCDETSKRINFEEVLQIKDVDKSIINQAPDSQYINTVFDYKDEELPNVNSVSDLKRINGKSYLTNSDEIRIITTVSKTIFVDDIACKNKYLYFSLPAFITRYSRLEWNNLDDKMFVFILDKNFSKFESDFLVIQSFFEKKVEMDQRINENAKHSYASFNNIYSSIYDDKKLGSYFEYPLTWYSLKKSETDNSLKMQMLNYFFKIICNKDLGNDKYLIRGHKTVTVNTTSTQISYDESTVVKELFEFILDSDKHHDKLSLLRNTLTIFLDSHSNTINFFNKSSEILKSVKFNFDLYIQDKVKLFLDQKNKLLQEFINTTRKIEELTNSLISQIRTISLSLLGSIFLSLLNDVNKSKTSAILNLVLLSYVFYFLINLLIVWAQNKQKDALLNNLEKYTKELGVIGENQNNNLSYDSLKNNYLKKSLDNYEHYRRAMLIAISLLTVLFVLLYIANRFGIFTYPKEILKYLIGY